TSANCDPPENMSRLSAMVGARPTPAATDSAPNETPYRPVATDTLTPWRTAARTAGVLERTFTRGGYAARGGRRGGVPPGGRVCAAAPRARYSATYTVSWYSSMPTSPPSRPRPDEI